MRKRCNFLILWGHMGQYMEGNDILIKSCFKIQFIKSKKEKAGNFEKLM